jgi:hypothetical protein
MQRDRKLTIPSKVRTCSSTEKKTFKKPNPICLLFNTRPPTLRKKKKKAIDGNVFAMHIFPIMHNVIQDIH